MFILARKLNWLSEELSPYRPPFRSLSPFSDWLNRDTRVTYDGAPGITAGERRLRGDPEFGVPLCGKCNSGRNRKQQMNQNRSPIRKRQLGSVSRKVVPLAPQKMGVKKLFKTAPSKPQNMNGSTRRAFFSLLSSQVSLDRPITIPDGCIDTSVWIIPHRPLPRDENELSIWYKGAGCVSEAFENWQKLGREHGLGCFGSE